MSRFICTIGSIFGDMKQLIVLIISNFLFLVSCAQDLPNSLLWKVEKEGGKPSYIFGTIHVLPQADFVLEEKVKVAFDESAELVMEMDMTDPALQMKMFQMMNMRDSLTLDQLLSKEDYDLLSEKLASIEGAPPLAMMNSFKPFMVATMMISEYVGSQPASFEGTLMAMSAEREMSVSGLEALEDQMGIFDSIPYADQAEDLMDMVEKSDEMKQLFADMVAQYKAEQVNELYKSTEEYMNSEEEMKYLLYDRNRNWAVKLDEMLGDKTYFIGVGAAHLGGENGIIMLLKKSGYKLTPIMD